METELSLLLLTYNQQGGSFSAFLSQIKKAPDFVIVAVEESCHSIPCSYFCWGKGRFEDALVDRLTELSSGYCKFLSTSLNAQALFIYTKQPQMCSCLRVQKLCVGSFGANKGAIVAHFCISNSPVCFAACHFAAGTDEKAIDYRRVHLGKTLNEIYSPNICVHQIKYRAKSFLLGDLNFRVAMQPLRAISLIENGESSELITYDELSNLYGDRLRDVLPICFNPTFKFALDRHYNTEKCPSFTDRIVTVNDDLAGDLLCNVKSYGGTGCGASATYSCTEYNSIASYESDHLPVFATMKMRVPQACDMTSRRQ